jgi:hypothetical protein
MAKESKTVETGKIRDRIRKLEDEIATRKSVIRDKERALEDYKDALKVPEAELNDIREALKSGRPVDFKAHCRICFKRFDEGIEDGEICSACGRDGY